MRSWRPLLLPVVSALLLFSAQPARSQDEIMLKSVSLNKCPAEEALQKLFAQAREENPGRKVPTLVMAQRGPGQSSSSATMELKDVPLLVAIKYVCLSARWDFEGVGDAVIVRDFDRTRADDSISAVLILMPGRKLGDLTFRDDVPSEKLAAALTAINPQFARLEVKKLPKLSMFSALGPADLITEVRKVLDLANEGYKVGPKQP